MTNHKYTNIVCSVIVALTLVLTAVFLNGQAFGLVAAGMELPYIGKLFSTDTVHTIDIVVQEQDWQELLDTAVDEEYISCSVVIDGDSMKNVGIRAKGNTSLSNVASSDSDRYSFKIEFDHYETGKSFYGLDKLALNNIIQDTTYLKDFLCYQMMNAAGAEAPLSSFAYITVNGEDWGLYLAVEAVEEAFAQRNYGSDYGEIYKPDGMQMGGGKKREGQNEQAALPGQGDTEGGQSDLPAVEETQEGTDGQPPAPPDLTDGEDAQPFQGGGMERGGGMGSDEASLIYSDDGHDSYASIFDSAVFDGVSDQDKDRLILALKRLNEKENLSQAVNIDEVIRYFAVHNFVLNGDSYTGSMIHNYYLHEKDGQLSMIAWDYNLAFGAFSMGGSRDAATLVNYPLDNPLLSGSMDAKPMIAWIFEEETYLKQYHQVFDEFLSTYFESGYFETMIGQVITMISPYVEKDPTKFCTYEEFLAGAEELREFCLLRAESLRGQLDGTIPSTSEGQKEDASSLVDGSSISISAMGSMGMGGGMGGNRGGFPGQAADTDAVTQAAEPGQENTNDPAGQTAEPGQAETVQTAVQTGEPAQLAEKPLAQAGAFVPGSSAEGQGLPERSSGDALSETSAENPSQESGTDSASQERKAGRGGQRQAGRNRPDGGNFPSGSQESQAQTQLSANDLILLGACGIALILGIVIAVKFKR